MGSRVQKIMLQPIVRLTMLYSSTFLPFLFFLLCSLYCARSMAWNVLPSNRF